MAGEDSVRGMGGLASILRRRWHYLVTIAPAAVLVAVYLAFSLPTLYKSTAIVMLEQPFGEKIDSTVGSSGGKRIELVKGRVMTVKALEEVIKEYDPYPNEPGLSDTDKANRIIENTSFEHVDPVTGAVDGASSAYALYYENPNPVRASDITQRLANLFLAYNTKTRTEAATDTAAFLEEQTKALTQELQEVDAQIAQMKSKYGESLPEAQSQNQFGLTSAERELLGYQRDIRTQEEREGQLQLQLNQISPNLISLGGDLTDLAKVRAALAEAEQNYTPDHPDVKRLRRAMADLIAKNAAGNGTVVKPNNPEYLRVEAQLTAVRRELAALRANAAQSNSDVARYTSNLRNTPAVEKEISSVVRRRESLQTQFFAAQEKLRNARLAQSFETESRGEKFTLARAPYPSRLPSSPNRVGMILLGFVIGSALAGIVVAIIESSDPTVRDSDDLPTFPGATLLGSIPVILTAVDRRKRALIWGSVAGVYAVAIAFVGFTVVSGGA